MEESKKMSFFSGPVTNKVPNGETTLPVLKELIESNKYKAVTEMVRKGKAKKNRDLDYFTSAGVFSYGNDKGIETYSGCPNFDWDDTLEKYGLDPETVKRLLAGDKLLNFNLLNISVSGTGVKGILTIKNARVDEHEIYYKTIEKYLLDNYGLKADPACRNISRAYYLNHDADVYYNADGFVEREALLKMNADNCRDEIIQRDAINRGDAINRDAINRDLINRDAINRDAINRVSTGNDNRTATSVPVFSEPDYSTGERPSDRLNRLPVIHSLARQAVESIGWRQKSEETWTRAGKDPKEGCSALWNIWDQEGIWIFTCFTTNGLPFKANKGYCDTQILCIINYNDIWMDCISDLAARYL